MRFGLTSEKHLIFKEFILLKLSIYLILWKTEVKNMIDKKEAAIQNEQQLEEKIIDEIIKILAQNNCTIAQSEKILRYTSQKIDQQVILFD